MSFYSQLIICIASLCKTSHFNGFFGPQKTSLLHWPKVRFLYAMCTEEYFLDFSGFRPDSPLQPWKQYRAVTTLPVVPLFPSVLTQVESKKARLWCLPGFRQVVSSFLRAVWRLGSGTRKMVSATPAILDSLAFSLFRPYEPVPCLKVCGMDFYWPPCS